VPVVTVTDDWWPQWLQDFASENPLGRHDVEIAKILATDDGNRDYRQVFTALVAPEHLASILEKPGGIGHEVASSGPHPAPFRGKWDYAPRFWIDAAGTSKEKLEPLVVHWRSGNQTVLLPDQGFLMTYGLVPRIVSNADVLEMHWDDPSFPQRDIVVSRPVSSYNFPTYTGAYVTVEQEYLQDYSTIRERALVQVYYVQREGPLTEEVIALLSGNEIMELRLPGRLIDLRLVNWNGRQSALAQVWGVRPLLEPGDAPVSAGRDNPGALVWPGIAEPVTEQSARGISLLHPVYVMDSVLEIYEGLPEYSVHPESGSVSYGNQWGVSYARRIGRNLIEVEIKKLYEGNHADTIRHWHRHAVNPPADPAPLRGEANVGTRARRIVYGLACLGKTLAELHERILGQHLPPANLVRLDIDKLDYFGWWTVDSVEPITRHIPLGLSEESFLSRCSTLYSLVGEGLSERHLRQMLKRLGVPPPFVEELRSIKLVDHLIQVATMSYNTGLDLDAEGSVLHERVLSEDPKNVLTHLFALNDLRQLHSHRMDSGRQSKLRDALKRFGMEPEAYRGGWGIALDTIYDSVGDTIEEANRLLSQALQANS